MRRRLCALLLALICGPTPAGAQALDADERAMLEARAGALTRLHTLLVVHAGETRFELVRGGPGPSQPANIKSLSKTVLSIIAGIAIDRGVIDSPERPVVELLGEQVPASITAGAAEITFSDLLSLQGGLRSTSGGNYGRWVQSENWVAHVLTRPMVAEPGERMIYSTGSSHLVAAALVEAGGRSVLAMARQWLGAPLDIRIPDWMRDPQGIHFGGNEMRLSPRALARIGELYRRGGEIDGQRVVSREWIEQSWTPYGRSRWSGDEYGYGWFITELAGEQVYYGRGYGGQMLLVIPGRELTVVLTSDPTPPSPGGLHFRQFMDLVAEAIIPAFG